MFATYSTVISPKRMAASVVILPRDMVRALESISAIHGQLTPIEQVRLDIVVDSPAVVVTDFQAVLLAALHSHGYAEVVGISPQTRYVATALIADLLGGLTGAPPGPLGGELTTVVTSSFFDHNLAWHTDSTSWELPNRWQILALLEPDSRGRPAPTSILPWSAVIPALDEDTVRVLAATTVGWREQFADLHPFAAPILGTPPRWLRPALPRYLADPHGPTVALAKAIAEATEYVDVEVSESSIVIFDNTAVLHRGPHLEPDGGRTIIRLKLGGRIGSLTTSCPTDATGTDW